MMGGGTLRYRVTSPISQTAAPPVSSRWTGFTATTNARVAAGETRVACEGGENGIMQTTPATHPQRRPVRSVKRTASASPATGFMKAHALEQAGLVALAFGGPERAPRRLGQPAVQDT